MKTFTDAAGRNWTIALNLGTAMAVKDTLGGNPHTLRTWAQIAQDTVENYPPSTT